MLTITNIRKYTIFDTSLYEEMENIEFKINLLVSQGKH